MSMTNTINDIVEDVSTEVQAAEVNTEEVSEEVLETTESEVSNEAEEEVEEVAEAKAKDEYEEDEEVEESAPAAPSIPKTHAGVINAAVEMLKGLRKHEAQQMFAKMTKVRRFSKESDQKSSSSY